MAWRVLLVIFLSGAVGAWVTAKRPCWDAFKGFLVGTFSGFALIVLFNVIVAIRH